MDVLRPWVLYQTFLSDTEWSVCDTFGFAKCFSPVLYGVLGILYSRLCLYFSYFCVVEVVFYYLLYSIAIARFSSEGIFGAWKDPWTDVLWAF